MYQTYDGVRTYFRPGRQTDASPDERLRHNLRTVLPRAFPPWTHDQVRLASKRKRAASRLSRRSSDTHHEGNRRRTQHSSDSMPLSGGGQMPSDEGTSLIPLNKARKAYESADPLASK
eukprot:scaffold119938_cov53-Attheya_sp.AAC.2